MPRSLRIGTQPTPFIVYLALAGIAGYAMNGLHYSVAMIMIVLTLTLSGLKRNFKVIESAESILSYTTVFGFKLSEKDLPIDGYGLVRNRIHFRGTMLSGNSCITELVGPNGNVLVLREEAIGFTNNIPSEAKALAQSVAELTRLRLGKDLIEAP